MRLRLPLLLSLLALAWSASADEYISYQGHLELQGQPFSGQADISFDFFDSPEGGSLLTGSLIPAVEVNDGLFQVELPAQSLDQSGEVWLQITVDGNALAERQRLRPVPRALQSDRVDTGYTDQFYWRRGGNVGTDPAQDYIGTVDDTPFHIRADGQAILRLEPAGNVVIDGVGSRGGTFSLFNLIGGHPDNQILPDGAGSVIAGGGGPAPDFHNEATGALTTIGGGMDNRVSGGLGTIGGGLGNRVHGESGTVAGGQGNQVLAEGGTVSGGVGNWAESFSSTVAGGGSNVAGDSGSVVSGGQQNQAMAQYSVVAGGRNNLAEGDRSTVSGGQGNEATGANSAVAGGNNATASGNASFVGGGSNNRAEGVNSAVLGGWGNLAEAGFSVAAGRLARALHPYSFVWSDGQGGVFESEIDREFAVRAAGGVRLVTEVDSDGDPTSGVFLAPGGSAWGTVSDRNAKMAIEYPEPGNVLQRVLALPIAEYSYRSQDDSIRHMGPMAQDFFPLFGLGENELRVNAVNLAGISLAAVQGLYAELKTERATNKRLSDELATLRARVDEMTEQQAETIELKKRLARLEAVLLEGASVAGR